MSGQGVEIGIIRVDDRLDGGVIAGIDLVAAAVDELLGRVAAKPALLHQIPDDVADDDLGIVAVDDIGLCLVLLADEHGLLIHGLVQLGLGDVALVIHLVEDPDTALAVLLLIDEGVVLRGHVRDADDAGALGQRELIRRLAEVGVRGGVDAVAALTEVDLVEIVLHDLLLGVLLLELQRLEDLQQLALHGDVVLLGGVLDELLRDGRAAEVVLHAEEHVHKRARGAVPVDALVLIKALVLDGDGRVLDVLRDVLIVDPDAVFGARELHHLLPRAALVLIEDGAGKLDREILELDVHLRGEAGLHVVREDAHEQQPRDEQHQQDRAQHAEDRADHAHNGARRPVGHGAGGILFLGSHRETITSGSEKLQRPSREMVTVRHFNVPNYSITHLVNGEQAGIENIF